MKALIINNEVKMTFDKLDRNIAKQIRNKYFKNIERIDLLNAQEQKEKGINIVDIDIPEIKDKEFQRLGEVRFDGKKAVYEIVDILLPLLEDAKKHKIIELKSLTSELYNSINWYFIRLQINDKIIPNQIKIDIKKILDLSKKTQEQINSLSQVKGIIKFKLPVAEINELRDQIELLEND